MLLRLTPLLGSSVGAAILGYNLLYLIPGCIRCYLLIPYLVLFLTTTILDREPGWNVLLLLGYSLMAGAVLNWSGTEAARWSTWVLFLGLVFAALAVAPLLGNWFQKIFSFLFMLMIGYSLGWLVFIITDLFSRYRGIWIMLGLPLLTLCIGSIFQRGLSLKLEDNSVPLTVELVVVLINTFWLAGQACLRC